MSLVVSKHNVPMVIGTTGFNDIHFKKSNLPLNEIPILVAPNMSFGVNATIKLLNAQNIEQRHDIEIIEAHHKDKVDSPSGTAIKMGELANTLNQDKSDIFNLNRSNKEKKRLMVKLAFHIQGRKNNRGPHSFVCSDSEILKIEHNALNRSFCIWSGQTAEFIYDKIQVFIICLM